MNFYKFSVTDVLVDGERQDGEPVNYASPFIWMVDGKEVATIPPGSEAVAIPKEYTITYDLNGGKKGKGKWIYKYRYGRIQKLPKPRKKGYFFAGWKTNGYPKAFSQVFEPDFNNKVI